MKKIKIFSEIKYLLLFSFLFSLTLNGFCSNKTYTVTVSELNLRSGPGTNYKIIGSLSYGQKVTLIEKNINNWYLVEADGKEGYVSSKYLKLDYSDYEHREHNNKTNWWKFIIIGIIIILVILFLADLLKGITKSETEKKTETSTVSSHNPLQEEQEVPPKISQQAEPKVINVKTKKGDSMMKTFGSVIVLASMVGLYITAFIDLFVTALGYGYGLTLFQLSDEDMMISAFIVAFASVIATLIFILGIVSFFKNVGIALLVFSIILVICFLSTLAFFPFLLSLISSIISVIGSILVITGSNK